MLPQGTLAKDSNGLILDQIQESIFDTLILNSASTINTSRSFFTSVQGKSEALTNMRQNNLLEAAVSFQVQGICIDAQVQSALNEKVLGLLQQHSAIRLRIQEKDYWRGNMRFVTGRLYVEQAIAGGTDNHRYFSQYGSPKAHGLVFARGNHVNIPSLSSFRLVWETVDAPAATTPDAAEDIYFVAQLKGMLRRPVQ